MVETIINETDIDPRFIGYSKDAIFSTPIVYDFEANYGKWFFPFGVTQAEVESKAFDPQLNLMYPLPDFLLRKNTIGNMRLTAERIDPMTIIWLEQEQQYYLAVKSSGKDFTWNIIRAYLWLGYLPPVWLNKLPTFKETDINQPLDKVVVLGIAKSIKIAIEELSIRQLSIERMFLSKMEGYDIEGKPTHTQ